MNVERNSFRNYAQTALSKGKYSLCSDYINILAWYGTDEAEKIYNRIIQAIQKSIERTIK